jgi:hypothetical protein
MLASLGRSSRTTWSAGLRSLNGLSVMVMRPTLSEGEKPVAPMNDIAASTFGSCAMISATLRCRSDMASNEMSCGPSTKQNSWPLSSLGRKPFGARTNSTPVAMQIATNTTITVRWCASVQPRLAA